VALQAEYMVRGQRGKGEEVPLRIAEGIVRLESRETFAARRGPTTEGLVFGTDAESDEESRCFTKGDLRVNRAEGAKNPSRGNGQLRHSLTERAHMQS